MSDVVPLFIILEVPFSFQKNFEVYDFKLITLPGVLITKTDIIYTYKYRSGPYLHFSITIND